MLEVGGDAGPLHARQHVDERQLDLAQQPGAAPPLEVGLERLGQVEHRVGADHGRLGDLVVDGSSSVSKLSWPSADGSARSSRRR